MTQLKLKNPRLSEWNYSMSSFLTSSWTDYQRF
jgi:hypothetical protein